MELAFDTSKIAIFDADTGTNLTIAPSGSDDQSPEPPAAPATPPAPAPSEQTPPPAE
jgi:multiple sugar transport system ATP-binding protein